MCPFLHAYLCGCPHSLPFPPLPTPPSPLPSPPPLSSPPLSSPPLPSPPLTTHCQVKVAQQTRNMHPQGGMGRHHLPWKALGEPHRLPHPLPHLHPHPYQASHHLCTGAVHVHRQHHCLTRAPSQCPLFVSWSFCDKALCSAIQVSSSTSSSFHGMKGANCMNSPTYVRSCFSQYPKELCMSLLHLPH